MIFYDTVVNNSQVCLVRVGHILFFERRVAKIKQEQDDGFILGTVH